MKPIYKVLLSLIISFTVVAGYSQSNDAGENKRIVESKNYIFKAQSAIPSTGKTWQLTSDYDLTVNGDSIVAYLPYFGRAYSAPIDPADGGIKFTSTNATYRVATKKDRWEISIKPKDVRDVQQMNLDITSSGYATLRVISTNRQPISFYGYVVEGKERAKKAF